MRRSPAQLLPGGPDTGVGFRNGFACYVVPLFDVGTARDPIEALSAAQAGLKPELSQAGDFPVTRVSLTVTAARGERATASELEAQARGDLARVEEAISSIPESSPVLAMQPALGRLDGQCAVVTKAAGDLERRRAELERIDARIATARAEARLAKNAELPTAGWRRRVCQPPMRLSVRSANFRKFRAARADGLASHRGPRPTG